MIIKSYFNGGNEADSSQYDQITLATVCGTNQEWRPFEEDWKAVLRKHNAPFLHTTDAVSLNGEFSKGNGWDKASVDSFISDCVKTVGEHIAIPLNIPNTPARPGLYVVMLSIRLDDFIRARGVNPRLPNTVEEVCATESLGFCFQWGKHLGAHWYHLYFDQGEPFFGHIYDRKHNKKSKKTITLMEKISHLGESDMRLVPALQLADLFAWCINHNKNVTREWHGALHELPWQSLYLDFQMLLSPITGIPELVRSWKLPRRKPTK